MPRPFVQRTQCFSQSHQRVAVIVFRIFGDDSFEEGARFGRPFLAQQTLTQMRARIDVLRVAFQRGAIAAFGLLQLALLKIDIAELE